MLETYRKYKESGLACLPTAKDKLPAIPKGESWLGGWNNESEYQSSFGLGIICGNISGNLECIDFDNHFGDAKQVMSDFLQIAEVREIYDKYKLPIQSTTSGGFHLLYRCSVIAGNQKLASRPKYNNETKKYKKDVLIETRGEGGYFCASPTPGYNVVRNNILKLSNIIPEEREILLTNCKSFNTYSDVKSKPEEDKDKPGNIYNNSSESLSEMEEVLKCAGWTEPREGYWLRPGKKRGVSATLGRVAPGVFYNFSSSSDPFEDCHGYTAFQVVALLKYNGDFSGFAKDLVQRYNLNAPIEKKEEKTVNQLDEIIRKCYVDTTVPVVKPPVIMKIRTNKGPNEIFSRVMSLGNFSAIIGKSKAKKTFLATMFMACATKGGELDYTIQSDLPGGRPGVVLFDTEQSNYDAYISAKRVVDMSGRNNARFGSFDLREFSPLERCDIINRFIEKRSFGVSFIVIDGIADLAMAINDEIEASRVVSLLMRWTKVYNVHIAVIIHQNKNDNFATGHLGSSIMKKAECIMSVTKDASDSYISEVSCDYIRGSMEFDKFNIEIDKNGIPYIAHDVRTEFKEAPFYEK